MYDNSSGLVSPANMGTAALDVVVPLADHIFWLSWPAMSVLAMQYKLHNPALPWGIAACVLGCTVWQALAC